MATLLLADRNPDNVRALTGLMRHRLHADVVVSITLDVQAEAG